MEGLTQALLGKWLWRFSLDWESLWTKIIHGKFGELEEGWTTWGVTDSFGMSIWKNIRRGWENFSLRLTIQIRNGRHTRFWWDRWAGEFKLKDVFPLLFRIAPFKNVAVADLWDGGGGRGGHWEVHFRRSFWDYETKEMTQFLELIYPLKVQEGEDTLFWKYYRRGNFNVKFIESNLAFLAKEIWGSQAPLRTWFFAWEVVWGKVLTIDMLIEAGMTHWIDVVFVKIMKNQLITSKLL